MNKREYKKLNTVHNAIKDLEGRIQEAVDDDDPDAIRDLIREVESADETVTELMRGYENQ